VTAGARSAGPNLGRDRPRSHKRRLLTLQALIWPCRLARSTSPSAETEAAPTIVSPGNSAINTEPWAVLAHQLARVASLTTKAQHPAGAAGHSRSSPSGNFDHPAELRSVLELQHRGGAAGELQKCFDRRRFEGGHHVQAARGCPAVLAPAATTGGRPSPARLFGQELFNAAF